MGFCKLLFCTTGSNLLGLCPSLATAACYTGAAYEYVEPVCYAVFSAVALATKVIISNADLGDHNFGAETAYFNYRVAW